MGRIKGRADDMLIIRGVNVYPTQVEAALLQLPELTPNYRIVVSRSGTLDEAEVEVEVSEEFLGTKSCVRARKHACARASAARWQSGCKHRARSRPRRAESCSECSTAAS
jgi:phenylacetate-coenzyme A ligase PaaK-like adenylate-forming protein